MNQESTQQVDMSISAEFLPASPNVIPISDQARIVEAVLFAAPEPLTVAQLRAVVPGDADMGAALAELQTLYAGRGVTLKDIDGRWAFRTADTVAPHLYQFRREEKKLSRAALETLAIIAYHQPVTRTEIENIRGVAVAKGTLDLIMEMGWIKPGKRREIPGRPLTWLTTPAFLDHFGLSNLNELPGMDDLKAAGLMDTRPAIETLPDLFAGEDAALAADAGVTLDAQEDSEDLEMLPSTPAAPSSVSLFFSAAAVNQNVETDGDEDDDLDDDDDLDSDEEMDADDDDFDDSDDNDFDDDSDEDEED